MTPLDGRLSPCDELDEISALAHPLGDPQTSTQYRELLEYLHDH